MFRTWSLIFVMGLLASETVLAALRMGVGNATAKRGADIINRAQATSSPTDENHGSTPPSSRLKWHYLGEPVYYSSPAVGSDGTVYFATTGHFVYFNGYWSHGQKPPAKPYGLYAYNPDGTLKWKYTDGTDAPGRGSPAIASDGTIYIVFERLTNTEAGTTQELHAVNPDGTQKWKQTFCSLYAEIGAITPSIAADGTIYVSCADLTAFHPDGTLYWTSNNGSGNGAYLAPAIASDGTIYGIFWTPGLAGGQTMQAWNPDGTIKWTGSTIIGSFASTCSPSIAADGTVYIGGTDPTLIGGLTGTLFAFDSTGNLTWKFATGDYDVRSSPAIDADGTIYFGTKGNYGYIYALNPDGTQKWRYTTADDALGGGIDVYASPAIGADSNIYIANEWGWIYSFKSDGTLNWKDATIQASGGTNWSSPAIIADGTMYLGNTMGEFMAITTDSLGLKSNAQWAKFRYSLDNNGRRP